MENKSVKSYSRSPRALERRKRAKQRLENQLLTGYKPVYKDGVMSTVPLTEHDKTRIKKEISTLKARI